MNFISDEDGKIPVKIARTAVTEFLKTGKTSKVSDKIRTKFSFNSGVFVTLNIDNDLRGCIGFPTSDRKLYESLVSAAISSATEDPRFPPVEYAELNKISFEVTVLTQPEVIRIKDPLEYLSAIKVGQHGLIVRWEFGAGILLPQVPVEYGWDVEEFLSHTCQKAGAHQDCWKQKSTIISKFEGIVFKETKPNDVVIRMHL
jgi:uncharacterized protein (TIGR00296 family)